MEVILGDKKFLTCAHNFGVLTLGPYGQIDDNPVINFVLPAVPLALFLWAIEA